MTAEFAELVAGLGEKPQPRLQILSREEIEASLDPKLLADLEDEYEAICIRIETCLRFPMDVEDREWFRRARGALMAFTIAKGRVNRRLRRIGHKKPRTEAVAPQH